VDHSVNSTIKNELKGALELVGVFKAHEYTDEDTATDDDEYIYNDYFDGNQDDIVLFIAAKKISEQAGAWGGKSCLLAQLHYSSIADLTSLVEDVRSLPTNSKDQDNIGHQTELWNVYLDILKRNVKDKRFEVSYRGFREAPNSQVVFHLAPTPAGNKMPWDLIKKANGWTIKLKSTPQGEFSDTERNNQDIGTLCDYDPDKKTLTVELKSPIDILDLPQTGFLFYDAGGDEQTVNRMQRGMKRLVERKTANPAIADFIFDAHNATPVQQSIGLKPGQVLLENVFDNENQRKAIEGALAAKDLFLIHGPPGTGKTTIISEICYQIVRQGGRVLIASQSNLAVDNAIAKLVRSPEIRAIRLGRADRVEEEGKPFIEENVVENWLKDTRSQIEKRIERDQEKQKELDKKLAENQRRIESIKTALDLQVRQNKLEHDLQENETQHETLQAQVQTMQRFMNDAGNDLVSFLTKFGNTWEKLPEDIKSKIETTLGCPDSAAVLGEIEPERLKDFVYMVARLLRLLEIIPLSAMKKRSDDISAFIALLMFKSKKERLISWVEDIQSNLLTWRELGEENQRIVESLLKTELIAEIGKLDRQIQAVESSKGYIKSLIAFYPALDKMNIAAARNYLEGWHQTQEWAANVEKKIPELLAFIHKHYEKLDKRKLVLAEEITDIRRQLEDTTSQLNHLASLINSFGKITKETLLELEGQSRELKLDQARLLQRQDQQDFINAWLNRLNLLTDKDISDLYQIYIDNVNVVGATCSGSGRKEVEDSPDFDCVIVDEVSKAMPPEIILPAIKGKKLILVGDHKQLPPLFEEKDLGEVADELNLSSDQKKQVERSLFENLFENADPSLKKMLTKQYRMHPQIMEAINCFYGGELECGIRAPDRDRAHYLDGLGSAFEKNHLVWIDIPNSKKFFEKKVGTSQSNDIEAMIVSNLERRIFDLWDKGIEETLITSELQLGIISFYAAQIALIKKKLAVRTNPPRIGTVDRFQGIEREVVIASLVRNNDIPDIGFAKKPERINVALSRAKRLLVIIGCSALFTHRKSGDSAKYYKGIFEHIRQQGAVIRLENAPAWLAANIEWR